MDTSCVSEPNKCLEVHEQISTKSSDSRCVLDVQNCTPFLSALASHVMVTNGSVLVSIRRRIRIVGNSLRDFHLIGIFSISLAEWEPLNIPGCLIRALVNSYHVR